MSGPSGTCRAALLALALLGAACGPDPTPGAGTPGSPPSFVATGQSRRGGHTFALLLNGGGDTKQNYRSHVVHLRRISKLLLDAGTDPGRILVLSGDGPDPAPDQAAQDRLAPGLWWLLDGLRAGAALRTETRYENTVVGELPLRPATRTSLGRAMAELADRMLPGDTLLLYVTDHGRRNNADLDDNAIVLWGQELRVRELAAMLAPLPDGVRVVALMSQCFSGAFANLVYPGGRPVAGALPDGDTCGFFSATADRPAYGCYARNRGRDDVGHSFRFFEALASSRRLDLAEHRVLLSDRTPDVPHRSSQAWLVRALAREATLRGMAPDTLADELLRKAWGQEKRWADAFEQIDELGRAFGSFGPRSLAELDDRAEHLPGLARDLDGYAERWQAARRRLGVENFREFLAGNPFWKDYLDSEFLDELEADDKRDVAGWLLEDLEEASRADGERWQRLESLNTLAEEASAAAYRMEVRLAVVLRMRMLLQSIAAEVLLDEPRFAAERQALGRLRDCERFAPGPRGRSGGRPPALPPPFPSMAEELELLGTVLPGWIGAELEAVPAGLQTAEPLPGGAMRVARVFPAGPAAAAGLRPSDVVLGPPGAWFADEPAMNEWVLTSLIGQARPLEILRDGRRRTIELRPGAAPVRQ